MKLSSAHLDLDADVAAGDLAEARLVHQNVVLACSPGQLQHDKLVTQ